MQPTKDLVLPVERLTPADEHCFFGYYDIPAWDASDRRHLCHRVAFRDRLPTGDDVAILGMIRLSDHAFIPIGETNAWCFQQGSMLQWHPLSPNKHVIFNRCDGERYVGVIRDVESGEERILSRPVTNVDSSGRHALSINFSRLFDFRAGYGYANLPDPWANTPAPADDGIFLTHLETGKSELILSYADMLRYLPPEAANYKILVNHITFNTDGTRFVALVRTFTKDVAACAWKTALLTADCAGRDVYLLRGFGCQSHYHWRDPRHLLIWGDAGGPMMFYLLTDRTQHAETPDPVALTRDYHGSYSPDRRWLLGDDYREDGYWSLNLYNFATKRTIKLGAFHCDRLPTDIADIRCDLHPRWNRAGTAISFDSIHEGHRHVYWMDVEGIVVK